MHSKLHAREMPKARSLIKRIYIFSPCPIAGFATGHAGKPDKAGGNESANQFEYRHSNAM
ncbi:hypothetical protein [Dechloromonas sp.]|uniref:hypothetical protein n=1 Tax=Dechloromonas sp. TaxID=1917218 RepID=UPI00286E5F75|nr:hypothetical protein [Dechloromonas sp.]